MTPKRFGLYIHGNYIHTSFYCDVQSPFKRTHVLFPNYLAQVSYLKNGDPQSQEIFESVLVGAQETFEQIQTGFFPLSERIQFLKRLYEKISDHSFGLADVIAREVAKPITLAKAEVERSLLTLKYTIESAEEVLKIESFDFSKEKIWSAMDIKAWREPRGPLLAITPFNFPLNLVIHKLAPAIAAGCPVLLKPSPKALLTALSLVDLCHACELPAGMLCFVPCDNEITLQLAKAKEVAHVSFTGSSQVGWWLKSQIPEKNVFLELGGTAPTFVDETCADLDRAATLLAQSAFSFAGQSCISCQNLFVHQKILDMFQKKLVAASEKLLLSEPQNEKAHLSAVIDQEARLRIQKGLEEAQNQGAYLLFEGEGIFSQDSELKESSLVKPTILLNTPPSSSLYREEVFGPVLNLLAIESEEAFIREVNSYSHRLQVSLFSENSKLKQKVAQVLNYGGVIWNFPPNTRVDAAPYGGEGLSGTGREGPRWAIEDFTRWKTFIANL